jgi:hypothetical protein
MNDDDIVIFNNSNSEDRSAQPKARLNNDLMVLAHALEPLGAIGQAMVHVHAYKAQIARLSVEREHVEKAAEKANEETKAKLNVALEQIDLQRELIAASFLHAQEQLRERHLTRVALINALQNAMRAMTRLHQAPRRPAPEVLQTHRDIIASITRAMTDLEATEASGTSILRDDLKKTTVELQRALDSIPTNKRLDSESE